MNDHRPSRIPDFRNRQEMAEWFDTHDVADYWDELKPVKVRFAKNLADTINVRFDPDDLDFVREQAHDQGLGPTQLIRKVVKDWIKQHRQPVSRNTP